VWVLALIVGPITGCSDEGDAGAGGTGGAGDSVGLCEGVTCEDTECKIDGACDASDGMCDYMLVEDGIVCSDGECLDGVCAPVGAFPCTEEGIRGAIAEGGGQHFFACDGPTTVVTEAEIEIDNDVILDGEGKLIVAGNEDHRVFFVVEGVTAELRGLTITKGHRLDATVSYGSDGGGIYNEGTLTLTHSAVSGNAAEGAGGGILNAGTLTLTQSTVSGNTANVGGGGIFNIRGWPTYLGTLMLADSTVSGNTAGSSGGGGIHSIDGTVMLTNSTVSGNTANLGGGILSGGRGATLTLTNSTVSGNSAEA
jgi:hypothetical protein